MAKTPRTHTNLRMKIKHHRRIKALAASRGLSLDEFIMECVRLRYPEELAALEQMEANRAPNGD